MDMTVCFCVICQDNVVEKKLLPCTHPYCSECIAAYIAHATSENRRMFCPLCHKEFRVTDEGFEAVEGEDESEEIFQQLFEVFDEIEAQHEQNIVLLDEITGVIEDYFDEFETIISDEDFNENIAENTTSDNNIVGDNAIDSLTVVANVDENSSQTVAVTQYMNDDHVALVVEHNVYETSSDENIDIECYIQENSNDVDSDDEQLFNEQISIEELDDEELDFELLDDEEFSDEELYEEVFYDEEFLDENFVDENFVDENMVEESFADENFIDENFAEENFADESFTDENFADESLAEHNISNVEISAQECVFIDDNAEESDDTDYVYSN